MKDSAIYLLLERNGKELKLTDAADKTRFPWVGSDANGGMMTGTGMAVVSIYPCLVQHIFRIDSHNHPECPGRLKGLPA